MVELDWLVWLSWEDELLKLLSLSHGDGLNLGSHHRESIQLNTVELIEATPETRLTKSHENFSHVSGLMLSGTVVDNDEDSKSATKILDCLSLSSSSWTSWGTSKIHLKSLCKRDVTFFCQIGDTKSLLDSKIFVLILEVHVCAADENLSLISLIRSPVESGIPLPVEVGEILDLASESTSHDIFEKSLLVDMDCHKSLNLSSLLLGWDLLLTLADQLSHDVLDEGKVLLEDDLSVLLSFKALLDLSSPENLNTEKGNLGNVLSNKVTEWKTHNIC
jgi:hypothetical protein